jgi:Fe-S-cluster containining protein
MDSQLQTIIANYRKLCDYCDAIWQRARAAYPNEIACRKGCGICCELQSVNRIEAHIINLYIIDTANAANTDFLSGGADNSSPHTCPFLRDQSCAVYPARPIICRTHGLILRSTEFAQTQAASCPYNFPSIHPNDVPPELTADVDLITKNLANLNLAFCMVTGIDVRDGMNDRVLLRDFKVKVK